MFNKLYNSYNKFRAAAHISPKVYFARQRIFLLISTIIIATTAVVIFFAFNKPVEVSASWYNDSWLYRKTLTIDPAQVAGDLTDFPVLVSFTDSDVATSAQEDADDIIFIDSSGEKLAHEIESYASTTGTLVAWVKVPNLSSSLETQIYMYYGNAGVSSQEQPTKVWGNGYQGVWHLADATTASDSTGNAGDGTPRSVTASSSGQINGAVDFAGSNSDIEYDSNWDVSSLPITASAWVNPDNCDDWNNIISKRSGWSADQMRFHFQLDRTDCEVIFGSYGSHRVFYNFEAATSTWTYLTVVATDATTDLYLNGSYVDSAAAVTLGTDSNASVRIGSTVTGDFFDGLLDEVRISSTNRSANWIQTEYNNQNDPASFFSVSAQEQGKGPVGYWSFDEGYGTTANDGSGQGHSALINGASWEDESMCVSGKCLQFDGTDDFASSTLIDLSNTDAVTLSFWLKHDFENSNSTALEFSENINDVFTGFGFFPDDDNALICQGRLLTGLRGTSGWNTACFERPISGVWHHYSIIYDKGEEAANEINMYIDGALQAIGYKRYENNSTNNFGEHRLNFMSRGGGEEYEDGFLDEVKIYPYARSADEIKADYNAGLSGMQSNTGVAASFGGSSDKWMSDGLVGYWKFDESATTTGAVDSSGNGITGSYEDTASTTAGKYGNGAIFDGTDDYIDLGTTQLIDSDAPFTVSYWARLDGIGSYAIPLTLNTENSENWRTYYSSGNNYVDFGCDAYGEWGRFRADLSIEKIGYMHNVIITYNGQGKYDIDNFKFYANGVSKDLEAGTGFASDTGNSRIGNYSGGNSWWWDGIVDEVRIYNRALSPDEVQKLYEWAPGPVAHWKFDEKSGTTAYDSVASTTFSGNNFGTLGGDGAGDDIPSWTLGKFGSALDLDGSNDYVSMDRTGLNFNNFTIGAWVYRPSGEPTDDLFGQSSGSGETWALRVDSTGFLTFYAGGWHNGSGSLNVDAWNYITVVGDGSNLTYYIDGIFDSTDSATYDFTNNDSTFRIGYYPGQTRYFKGKVDDVKIYNYARTQKQILEDMSAKGGSAFGGNGALDYPVLHLSFDEGKGATAYDSSIHGNNGTLYPGTGGANTASSAMWDKNGAFGGAMEFDGDDDYVDFGDVNDVEGSEITISAWVYPRSLDTFSRVLVSKQDDGDSVVNYQFEMHEANQSYGFCFVNSGWHCLEEGAPVEFNRWQHALVTYDGATIKIYVDGELKSSTADASTLVGNSYPMRVGNPYTPDALIDEVQIWNYALSASEVKTVYNVSKAAVMGERGAGENDGTTVTGKAAEYCVPGDTSPCDAPVLELKFDELTGTTTYDTSGNGNDGTISGATWSVVGKHGSALDFDGLNCEINLGEGSSIDNIWSGGGTVSGWMKPRSAGENSHGNIVSRMWNTTGGGGYLIHKNSNGSLALLVDFDGTASDGDWDTDDSAYNYNEWTHFAVVYNKDSENNDPLFYINGISVNVNENATPGAGYSAYDDSTRTALMGSYGGSNTFDGFIDDFRMYNYARTPAQIAWDYNGGGPIAHWDFDECAGSTIHDQSGNNNHGTLNLGSSGITATGTCAESASSFWYNGRDGKINGAGSFDGGDDYASSTLIASDYDEMTMSVWFKADTQDDSGEILVWGSSLGSGNNFAAIFQRNTGSGVFIFYSDYAVRAQVAADIDIWHHGAIVLDSSNLWTFYLDGEILSTYQDNSSHVNQDVSNHIYIGRDLWGTFDGLIDEVKLWNYALTPEQVKTEYNGGAVSFGQ